LFRVVFVFVFGFGIRIRIDSDSLFVFVFGCVDLEALLVEACAITV